MPPAASVCEARAEGAAGAGLKVLATALPPRAMNAVRTAGRISFMASRLPAGGPGVSGENRQLSSASLGAMRKAAPWAALGAITAAVALALAAIGMPSPTLFAALVVGLGAALTRPQADLKLPSQAFLAAQAVCGVTIGAYLQADALKALGHA